LALHGDEVQSGVDPKALAAWGQAEPVPVSAAERVAAASLSVLGATTLLAWLILGFSPWPFVAVAAIEGGFAWWARARAAAIVGPVERRADELRLLAGLLARLERERFRSPRLQSLRAALDANGLPPSRQIARLAKRVRRLELRRNTFFAPIGWVLLWTTQCA